MQSLKLVLFCESARFIKSIVSRDVYILVFKKEGVCGAHVLVKLLSILSKLDYSKSDWKQKLTLSLLLVLDRYNSIWTTNAVMVANKSCHVLLNLSSDSKHLARIANYSCQLLKSDQLNFHYTGLTLFTELAKRDKSQLSQHQDLIVSALSSTDSSVADKSLLLIIQLTTSANIQSVYQLHTNTYTKSGGARRYINCGMTILTSCQLSQLSIDWFVKTLLELFKVEREHRKEQTTDQSSIFNTLLDYVGGDSEKQSAAALYSCLEKSLKDVWCLDVLTVMLWLKVIHKTAIVEGESSLISLFRLCCQNIKAPYMNAAYLLSALRTLAVESQMDIQESDLQAIEQLLATPEEQATCYVYLRDIKNIVAKETKHDPGNDGSLTDSFLANLKAYTQAKVRSQACRSDSISSSIAEVKSFRFSPERDIPFSVASLDGSAELGAAKTVWTAKGMFSFF